MKLQTKREPASYLAMVTLFQYIKPAFARWRMISSLDLLGRKKTFKMLRRQFRLAEGGIAGTCDVIAIRRRDLPCTSFIERHVPDHVFQSILSSETSSHAEDEWKPQ